MKESIRKYIGKSEVKNYAIKNEELMKLEDIEIDEYLTMLALLVVENLNNEAIQLDIFKKIAAGVEKENEVEKYIKVAEKEIEIEQFAKFMQNYEGKELKYRFVLDAILICSAGKGNDEQLDLLVGMIESLKIKEAEMNYLIKLAKSILEQNEKSYEEIRKIPCGSIKSTVFLEYVKNYVNGIVYSSEDELFVHYAEKENADEVFHTSMDEVYEFFEKEVYLENIRFFMQQNGMIFANCEKLVVDNCDFIGDERWIQISCCKNVVFRNCKFSGFNTYVIVEEGIERIEFHNCEFENCTYSYSGDRSTGIGGVMHTDNNYYCNTQQLIEESIFKNCKGVNSTWQRSQSLISNIVSTIKNCEFYNCFHINYDEGCRREDRDERLFPSNSTNIDNKVVDGSKVS